VDVLSIDLIGLVPMDEKVIVSTNTGAHLIQNNKSKAGQAFKRVAMRLNGNADLPIEVPQAKKGFWKKLGFKLSRNK
jgi:septum site-determining protein MinD